MHTQFSINKTILLTIMLLLAAGASVRAQLSDDLAVARVQPLAQMLELGSGMTLSVADSTGQSFQWMHNGAPILNQTNSTLTILNAQPGDAGFYSCTIVGALDIQTTVTTSLQVFRFTPDSQVVVYAAPVWSSGTLGTCPGAYKGYVTYIKTAQQGWGWAPSSSTTVYTATDNNSSNTTVMYLGDYGDSGCAQTSVTIPYPAFSDVYRFTIFFTNSVPTTNYPITLSGFNP